MSLKCSWHNLYVMFGDDRFVCVCAAQYMDRIYVKHQNKAPVTQLGLELWRDCVVRRRGIRDRMLGMLLDLIHRERTGDIVDRALLRAITTVRSPPSSIFQCCGITK